MSDKKEIYVRYGVSDIIVPIEESEQDDFQIDENAYFIGYEDEEGNECNEDGTPL